MKIDKSKKDKIKQGNQKDFDLLYDVLVNGGTYSDYRSELQDRSMPQEQQNFDISEDDVLATWILGKDEESEQYARGGHIHQGFNSNLYRQQFGGTWNNSNFNSSDISTASSSQNTGSSESIGSSGFDIGSGLSNIATPAGQLVDNTIVNWLDTGNYGDWKTDIQGESIDPLARLVSDIGGAPTDNAIERLKAERLQNDPNFAIGDTASNLSQYYAYIRDRGPKKQEIQTRDFGARVMDNLNASGQGALQGAKFGPWGALIGGIIGGVANIPSQILEDKNRQKLNNEILKYNIGLDQGLKEFDTNLTNSYKMQLWNQLQQPYLNTYSSGGKMKNKLASGGYINSHYDYITDPLVKVDAGGTHQENPNEGVQTSIAPDGKPNLVEQGETIIDNGQEDAYVFSDRIVADEEILKSHLLPNKFAGKTYADISKELDKIIEEHKNDEISKRTFDEMISRLQQAQEDQKFQEKQEEVEKFLDGLTDEQKEQLEQTMVQEAQAEQQAAEEQAVAEQQAQEQAVQEQQMQPEQAPEQTVMEQPEEQIVPSRYDQMMSRAQFADAANRGMFGLGGHLHQLEDSWMENLGNPMDAYVGYPVVKKQVKPGYVNLPIYEQAYGIYKDPNTGKTYTYDELFDNKNTKPFTRNNYHQNENTIFLEDDSPMNQYTASVMSNVNSSVPELQDVNIMVDNAIKDTKTPSVESTESTSTLTNPNPDKSTTDWATYLRYAPAIGSGIQYLSDLFGVTNRNDYTNPNLFQRSINAIPNVGFTPLGGYRTFNPFDETFQQNALRSMNEAARRAVINNSNGNYGATLAALNALNYNTSGQFGDLALKAREYNEKERQAIDEYNLKINQINASLSMNAQEKNQAIAAQKARLTAALAEMRQQIEDTNDAAKSANMTNFYQNLGNVGKENFNMTMVRSNPAFYYTITDDGHILYKNGFDGLNERDQAFVRSVAEPQAEEQRKKHLEEANKKTDETMNPDRTNWSPMMYSYLGRPSLFGYRSSTNNGRN